MGDRPLPPSEPGAFVCGPAVISASTCARSLSCGRGTATSPASRSAARASACAGSRRGQDSLGAGELPERGQRLFVARGQHTRLGRCRGGGACPADAEPVEPGRDRLGIEHLPVLVGEHGRARAGVPRRGRRRGSPLRGLYTDQAHVGVVEERREQSDRVGAPRRRRRLQRREGVLRPRAAVRAPRTRSPPGAPARSLGRCGPTHEPIR